MRRSLYAAVAGLVGVAAGVPAQERAGPGLDPPAARAGREEGVWVVPFELAGGKVYVDVMVNGRGPYPFVVDTGSPPTVIDSDLAAELGLAVTPAGEVGGAGEGSTAMSQVSDVALEFGGITLKRRAMPGVAINARLSGFSGRPVLGLIGNDFIATRVVELDYGRRVMTVRDPKLWDYGGDGAVIRTRRAGYTFFDGAVEPPGGEPIPARFIIDTGAGLGASLTSPFVERHSFMERAAPRLRATVGFGLGGEVRHAVCRLESLRIGGVEVPRPVVTLSQDRAGALAASRFDGIIGAEILSRFTVILDGTRGRMILEPGAWPGGPPEFDMSGMALAADGPGGRLRVMRVEQGTPAQEAGVREGDVLLAVDGAEVWATDREAVRERLKGDGRERRLELLRDGERLEARVALRRLVGASCPAPRRA